ncbi:hypothetical protein F5B21DRAFT_466307 [Xylaria acuta]|nr:hypothetical protein F5B21DRAFT_466307 [Xylaria acuta]
MCHVYREVHSACGHAGQVRVFSRCANIGKGTSCPSQVMGPVQSIPGKCAGCQRKDQQAQRLFGEGAADSVSDVDILLAEIRAARKH